MRVKPPASLPILPCGGALLLNLRDLEVLPFLRSESFQINLVRQHRVFYLGHGMIRTNVGRGKVHLPVLTL